MMGGAWGSSEPNGPPGSGSGLSEQVKEEGGPAELTLGQPGKRPLKWQ